MEVDGIQHALQPGSIAPSPALQTPVEVFEEVFLVFLGLGTLVGVVVIAYTLYNAYKYRDTEERRNEAADDEPMLGELPTGGGGGRKLFLSFFISAIIVISLIVWTYGFLLHVEDPDVGDGDIAGVAEGLDSADELSAASVAAQSQEGDPDMVIGVDGFTFGWEFEYPNGETTLNELRIPADTYVEFEVTSRDVWHTFGVTDLRIKADAIPGQTATAWVVADETGTYQAECFELCGDGHSFMVADVIVEDPESWEQWYDDEFGDDDGNGNGNGGESGDDEGAADTADNESDGGDA